MSCDAYVFGDLVWPMPDAGLIAVWRAMPVDASRWADWAGFVDAVPPGTIGELLDQIADGAPPADSPLDLAVDEHGAKLRAFLGASHAACWQRLAVAWRSAADLGAGGEFVWMPGDGGPAGIAYRAVIGDFASHWAKLTGNRTTEVDGLPGRREVDALVEERAPAPPTVVSTRRATTAKPKARAKTKPGATKGKAKVATATAPRKPTKRAPTAKPVAKTKRAKTKR